MKNYFKYFFNDGYSIALGVVIAILLVGGIVDIKENGVSLATYGIYGIVLAIFTISYLFYRKDKKDGIVK